MIVLSETLTRKNHKLWGKFLIHKKSVKTRQKNWKHLINTSDLGMSVNWQ